MRTMSSRKARESRRSPMSGRLEALEARCLLSGDQPPTFLSLDDGSAGFAQVGNWRVNPWSGYQGDSRSIAPGNGSGKATWTFTGLQDGQYAVFATWSASWGYATNAPFTVDGGAMSGTDGMTSDPDDGMAMDSTVRVDQRYAPADLNALGYRWGRLETVTVHGGMLTVTLSNDANSNVSADGILLAKDGEHQATITSVRAGLWSDPSTWDAGRVPNKADDVAVRTDVVIDRAESGRLDIYGGMVTLNGRIDAYGSIVLHAGMLQGNRGEVAFHVANDRNNTGTTKPGPMITMPDFQPDDTGLWVLGGSINLDGPDVTSWSDALPSGAAATSIRPDVSLAPAIGGGKVTLAQAPVGWLPGDTLLLVSTTGEQALAKLVSVDGANVRYTIQAGSNPNFAASSLVLGGPGGTQVNPKVGNLSRRLVIYSADVTQGDTNRRAHVAIMHADQAILDNVEFRDLGPRGKLGLYPVHFHRFQGEGELVGSSIWQDVTDPGNRFVTIHDTQNLTIKDNIAFRSYGHGFFMEDGGEVGNTLEGNLSVSVVGTEELPNVDQNISNAAHHFWVRAGNTVEGNVAAGGDSTSVGFILLGSREPNMPSILGPNQALGAGKYGFWTSVPGSTINGAVALFNRQAGWAGSQSWYRDTTRATLVNPILAENGNLDAIYGSQIFLNDSSVTVSGGWLTGQLAMHTHYTSLFDLEGVTVRAAKFLQPTYWELAGTVAKSDLKVAALTAWDTYPSRRLTPGLLRLSNVTGTVGRTSYTAASPLSADYSSPVFSALPGFAGTRTDELEFGSIRLQKRADNMGMIRLVGDFSPYTTTWRIDGLTKDFSYSPPARAGELPGAPGLSPFGLTAGTYQIVITLAGGRVIRRIAIVEAGKTTAVTI